MRYRLVKLTHARAVIYYRSVIQFDCTKQKQHLDNSRLLSRFHFSLIFLIPPFFKGKIKSLKRWPKDKLSGTVIAFISDDKIGRVQ
jgi:hypothetical protein